MKAKLEIILWPKNSWTALNCVHVIVFLSVEPCKLSARCYQPAIGSPSFSPQVKRTRKSIQRRRYDYISWQEQCAYISVFMGACARVRHGVSWLEERTNSWNTRQKIYTFFPERRETQAGSKWYTARRRGRWEHVLFSSIDSSSPGEPSCEPASSAGRISFIFLTVLLTWQ